MVKKRLFNKNLIYLSVFTFLFALLTSLFGYFALPISSAFYAAVLLCEKAEKRFFSYLLPLLTFVINFFINGIFSVEGVGYALVGIVIYFAYTKGASKADTAFYLSVLTVILMLGSLLILPFDDTGVVRWSAVTDFYHYLFVNLKNTFVSYVTGIISVDELGIKSFAFNVFEANELFLEIIILFIPVIMIFAFLLSGISLKAFTLLKSRYVSDDDGRDWSFRLSNLMSFFYIIISFISSLAGGKSTFDLSVNVLYYFFFAIFAYLGIKLVYTFLRDKFNRSAALMFILIIFFSFSLLFLQILSYVGAVCSIIQNKRLNGQKG
jgi:hypothetical protein